jgi:methionyl-tRNA formyltransferase
MPELGTINIHYSLLPKYRGASPLESTLLNADDTTGISVQQMAFKLDSGPILASKEIKIGLSETKEEIKNKLIDLGGNLLSEIIPSIIERKISANPQNESEATYCAKITKANGEIDLNSDPKENYNKYRAYAGWPGTYFFVNRNDKKVRVKINYATYENNLFNILKVTPEGKKTISYEDFIRQISI